MNLPLKIEETKSGYLTLYAGQVALHSTYNPLKEAEKIIAAQFKTENEATLLLGFGLGYVARLIIEQHPNHLLYLAEGEEELWQVFLQQPENAGLLKNKNVFCIKEGFNANYLLLQWDKQGVSQFNTITNRPLHDLNLPFYDKVFNLAQNLVMRKKVNQQTLKKYGRLWQHNLASNQKNLEKRPGVATLFNQFEGLPALLIAAGPSLNSSLSILSKLREKFLVIAVDTILPSLLKQQLQPDFIVSVDSQYWNSRHLDHCKSPNSLLVVDPSLNPSVVRKPPTPYLFPCDSATPLPSALSPKGYLHSGGSVATTAFSLAKALGCKSLWALGLDLAYPKGQSHTKGSRFEEWALADCHRLSPLNNRLFSLTHTAKTAYYPANLGGQVLSDERFTVYRLWFEEQAETFPSFNLSGGIALKNMPKATLQKALTLPPCRKEIEARITYIRKDYAKNDLL